MSDFKYSFINYETNYQDNSKSMFLKQVRGVLDTVNKKHLDLWNKYEELKSLDWSPRDVDLSTCNTEFKKAPPKLVKAMIDNLTWQWEGDSSVSTLIGIMEPFISNTEAMVYFSEVSRNEVLHSITYSEIVRSSFDDPTKVIEEMMKNKESFRRASVVNSVIDELNIVGAKIRLGLIDRESNEARDALMLFLCTLFCLERIQFMCSFAITFGIETTGWFLPICKLVQKIFIDEYHVHIQGDKIVLENELSTPEGIESFNRIKDKALDVINEITDREIEWLYMTYEDNLIEGITIDDLVKFLLYNHTDACNTLKLPNKFFTVVENPLEYLNKVLNINNIQRSPQDEDTTNYLVGGFIDDIINVKELDILDKV